MISIRKSTLEDLDDVLRIYAHARQQMKLNGNPHQWKDSEPSEDKIIRDIKQGNHYVVLNEGHICAVFSMIFGKDPTYSYIEGQWLNDLPYVTIHRIASDNSIKGVFNMVISYAFNQSNTVRIDTHKDNSIMQHLITRNGFSYCGIIYLENGEPRLAYQKTIL